MLEALSAKVMAGLVSLSMFLFSSYTGNDPALSSLKFLVGRSYLQVSTRLESAFDNDFPELFRSGTSIPIHFKLELKSKNRVVWNRQYTNRVLYDPATGIWTVSMGASGRSVKFTSYKEMLEAIAVLDCSVPFESGWGEVNARVEAWLPTVRFESIDRNVNLMVLWNYKRPVVKASIDLKRAL